MNIKITYCSVWNYQPRAAGLAADIETELNITPELVPGRSGVYDITTDNRIVFSKHQAKRFPDNKEIIQQIRQLLR